MYDGTPPYLLTFNLPFADEELVSQFLPRFRLRYPSQSLNQLNWI